MKNKNIQFFIDSYCEGAYPVDDSLYVLEKENWYKELISLISNNKNSEAEKFASEFLTAEYCLENVDFLNQSGFKFIKTNSVSVNVPFIEEIDGIRVPLFRWIGAQLVIEAPREIVGYWMEESNDVYKFNNELFRNWLEKNDCFDFNDGFIYNLGSLWYDLEGVGENGGSINKESIELSFNKKLFSK